MQKIMYLLVRKVSSRNSIVSTLGLVWGMYVRGRPGLGSTCFQYVRCISTSLIIYAENRSFAQDDDDAGRSLTKNQKMVHTYALKLGSIKSYDANWVKNCNCFSFEQGLISRAFCLSPLTTFCGVFSPRSTINNFLRNVLRSIIFLLVFSFNLKETAWYLVAECIVR